MTDSRPDEPLSTPGGLSHVGPTGEARMVDVSTKPETSRRAVARGSIRMSQATLEAVRRNQIQKGDVLGVARIAGIMAAKRTAELIPLCHPLPIHDVQLTITPDDRLPGLRAEAAVATFAKTGVEMEAITAVAIALVTVYDMAKSIDRGMLIGDIVLVAKSGGRSGDFASLDGTPPAPYPGSSK
ncbi:MAG: cyclic pyranopterin monophosphate synthase MoaC [Gemmatimonadaceae bacterium]